MTRGYGVNGLNQFTAAGSASLGYDGRGNLTANGSSAYTYTVENRLISGPGGVSISYDPMGRIAQLTQGASTTKFEHLGPRMILERNSGGTILRRYVHGPGDDEPVVWYEGSGTSDRRFLQADERGSVIAVTNSAGSLLAANTFDEYGVPGASNVGRFQYTGQAWLSEISLAYYKARMYDPKLGRFMQTDPTGYDDGPNWYAYVADDPINSTDPTGLCLDESCPLSILSPQQAQQLMESPVGGMLPGTGIATGLADAAQGKYVAAALGVATEVSGGKYLKAAGTLIAKAGRKLGGKLAKSVKDFLKKNPVPVQLGTVDAHPLPSGGIAVQATKPADNIPGSYAVYEKQIDAAGTTVQSTKTTYASDKSIVDVKDKITGETFVPEKQ